MEMIGHIVLQKKDHEATHTVPGWIILQRDEIFGPPFYRTALASNTWYFKANSSVLLSSEIP